SPILKRLIYFLYLTRKLFDSQIRHRSTQRQIETPDAMRGRVSAVNSLFIGTSNQLGEFESGVTAAWFGTKAAVLIGGLGTIVVATVWMRFFPALAKIDSFDTSVKKA
ncbi:MAG TPA: hypothetical protein VHO84_10220, partial [Syntrophorhabdaceae bacterium]|nr:hypothetical protein [Syntrophorhabdaceae bacterium]